MTIKIDKNKRYGFMPGCSLPSYSPEAVTKTTAYLDSVFPRFSAVQKCCGKPTKAVGQYDLFKERFADLQKDMDDVNIEEMIVACQSCKLTFDEASTTPTHSLWEILPLIGLPEELRGKAKGSDVVFTIHDSCSTRHMTKLHDGVRWILTELGYKYVESKCSREKTRCCGFGGMVVPANPEVAERVMKRRVETLDSEYVVVYCSACRSSILKGGSKAWHILDLVWGPVVHLNDEPPVDVLASPIKSWINRYKSKVGIAKVVK
ncbi:(Fe-S)-binding protein [Natronincola ferrireducens]|uniref:Cysteine-rich domain-containing protein n=1 Tax=Natronincola ferrireducens TaxID=393762 RepID=A0A1G9EI90_9FIRM|nr:(Fe-S)-binding protein [Natronincola ferrireducens]SDK75783.1 Cysteine-rich domain-containing protein [Natronincola ferrireducens]